MSQPSREALLAEAKELYDKEVELVSSCCGTRTTEPDADNLAKCLDCKENCIAEPALTFEDWLEEINN